MKLVVWKIQNYIHCHIRFLFKVSTCYEGWNENDELVGKIMSAGFEDGKTFQKLREAMIKSKYNTDEVRLRVLNSDGAG